MATTAIIVAAIAGAAGSVGSAAAAKKKDSQVSTTNTPTPQQLAIQQFVGRQLMNRYMTNADKPFQQFGEFRKSGPRGYPQPNMTRQEAQAFNIIPEGLTPDQVSQLYGDIFSSGGAAFEGTPAWRIGQQFYTPEELQKIQGSMTTPGLMGLAGRWINQAVNLGYKPGTSIQHPFIRGAIDPNTYEAVKVMREKLGRDPDINEIFNYLGLNTLTGLNQTSQFATQPLVPGGYYFGTEEGRKGNLHPVRFGGQYNYQPQVQQRNRDRRQS